MNSVQRAIFMAIFAFAISACGGSPDTSASDSSSGPSASASIVGTWINSARNQSWKFSGSSTSGSGEYRTASSNPTGTCDIIYIDYNNVNLSSGTFSYNGTGEQWTGAYPVPYKASTSKTYNSTVTINGGTAVIEGQAFTQGGPAC